jgi:outer membrane immunogenic protein
MKLKTLLVASALALLATGTAKAADVIVEQPPAPEVPVFTWTGFYVGIQGGYVWTDIDVDGIDGIDNLDGGLFGGYAGYNFQYDAWVFGIEGDFNGVWNDEEFDFAGPPPFSIDVGTDWLASIRGRVGYSWDRALIFATAGVGFTQASADVDIAGVGTFDNDETFVGWTVGGGLEYAFTDNWLGRVEYRYYGFDDQEFEGIDDVNLNTQTVTVGVAYKF